MSNKADVIVVGGGAVGICSAYYLWKAGLEVVVIEQNTVASGCSDENGGLIVPSHFIPLAAPGVVSQGIKWLFSPQSPFYIKPRLSRDLLSWLWKFRRACTEAHLQRSMPLLRDLNLASLQLYQELAALESLDFDLTRRGLLMLYRQEKGYRECREIAERAAEVGLEARLLHQTEIPQVDPQLNTSAAGGIYFPQDAHMLPKPFVQDLASYLEKQGVTILAHTVLRDFETANGKITAVKTTSGNFSARDIVLAGGAWSPLLARRMDLRLPIQAGKGYSFTVAQLPGMLQVPLILTEAKIAVTPMGNSLRFAGTLELAGIDLSLSKKRVAAIRQAIPEYLPQVATGYPTRTPVWTGLRPCTPDGLPLLGRSQRIRNLIVAAGHGMIGISLAPITGKLVAEIAAGQTPSLNTELLRIERF